MCQVAYRAASPVAPPPSGSAKLVVHAGRRIEKKHEIPSELRLQFSEMEFLYRVGQGASAAVWKAFWLGTEVAVKLLHPSKSSPFPPIPPYLVHPHFPAEARVGGPEEASMAEFLHECEVMRKLRHPNLVLLMGCCVKPLCVVTEFCNGGTLFQMLHIGGDGDAAGCTRLLEDAPHKMDTLHEVVSRQPSGIRGSVRKNTACLNGKYVGRNVSAGGYSLTWPQRVKIALDIAKGCTYLHTAKLIHRDLKSLNILLAELVVKKEDVPLAKITDFGLSRFTRQVEELITGWAGTMCWMAPEILNKQPYSDKVDVYSFGIILYELITSSLPYQDIPDFPPNELGMQVAKGLRPNLTRVPPTCPKQLSDLMVKCMANRPEYRPPFCDILRELREVQQTVDC